MLSYAVCHIDKLLKREYAILTSKSQQDTSSYDGTLVVLPSRADADEAQNHADEGQEDGTRSLCLKLLQTREPIL